MSCEEKKGLANADMGMEAVRDILSILGIKVHDDPPAIITKDGVFYVMEIKGIYPYIKNEDRAEYLQSLTENPPLGEAPNFRRLFRILRAEASPYKKMKPKEIVCMISKGGDNVKLFWNLCIKYEVPIAYSPNNKLTRYRGGKR